MERTHRLQIIKMVVQVIVEDGVQFGR